MSIRVPLLTLLLASGCVATHHPEVTSTMGTASRSSALLQVIDQPGPLTVETINSSDWKVNRSGLINLDDPKARAAGLKDEPEPIQIYFHVIHHPTRGTFIIDSGVERAIRDAPDKSLFAGLLGKVMHREWLKVRMPLGDWLATQSAPVQGVFLTHLHLDHIAGLRDLPASTPIYSGPGETSARALLNIASNGIVDAALSGKPAVRTWRYQADPDGRFDGVVDVFGDGSLWAIWTPGHTPGSTAYLARTTSGPVLFTGDTSHTVWGWEHHVEPGEFTADHPKNIASLDKLEKLAAEHPRMVVHLGHQSLPAAR